MDNLPKLIQETEELTNQFLTANKSLYLVGGVVRDLFLKSEITSEVDLDLTTDALPEEIKQIVAPIATNLWLPGEKFGTIGIRYNGRIYEITTHRAESYDPDSRKPEVTYSTNIEEDLSRRDFTINAMAISLPEGTLIDPFNGESDLLEGLLRTPLTPEESFSDDPLRMLRAARFTAAYNLTPAPELVSAIPALIDRFDIVSAERIIGELDKLLQAPNPDRGLHLLHETGLLKAFLPEVAPQRFQYLLNLPIDPSTRLAALLAETQSDECVKRLRNLRYSKERISTIQQVIAGANGILDDPSSESDYRRWYHQVGDKRAVSYLIALTLSDNVEDIWGRMEETRIRLGDDLNDFSLPISGNEIIQLLEVEEGRIIGEALQHLQKLRFDNGPFSSEDAQEILQDWWNTRSSKPEEKNRN
jgi:poly(A) polymerase